MTTAATRPDTAQPFRLPAVQRTRIELISTFFIRESALAEDQQILLEELGSVSSGKSKWPSRLIFIQLTASDELQKRIRNEAHLHYEHLGVADLTVGMFKEQDVVLVVEQSPLGTLLLLKAIAQKFCYIQMNYDIRSLLIGDEDNDTNFEQPFWRLHELWKWLHFLSDPGSFGDCMKRFLSMVKGIKADEELETIISGEELSPDVTGDLY